VADAQYQVEAVEIELLDGHREERQAVTVVPADGGQVLQQARVRLEPLDCRRNRSPHVHEREELGIRKTLAEDLQHFFAAAHPGEPVVDDRERGQPATCT